jgi:Zn-dependent protease with chaperone function
MTKPNRPLWSVGILATVLIALLTGCANKPEEAIPPQSTRDAVSEQSFEKQLNAMNPAAVQVYQDATTAIDARDYAKSKLLYEQVISLAPNFGTAYRRLAYIELYINNNPDHAIELLRKAMELEPDAYNQSALALALLTKATPSDYQEAYNLASTAVKSLPDDEQANLALLLSAAAVNNITVVSQVDKHLIEIAPSDPVAHYYAGLLAADNKQWEKAESELLYSEKLGMDSKVIQNALNQSIARNAAIIRFLRWAGIALVFWLAGLGILFLAGTILSRVTMRSLGKMDPTIGAQLQPAERSIRSIYRAVIVILSLYFYISIPFVILLLFFVVGGAFYLFFLIGTIPIQLAILLVIMLFASLFAILRSILVRRKDVQPGRLISRTDAPELWTLVEQVARKLETRPVDSIYVTPYASIAVNEKGSILKKLRRGGQRNLLIGMAVLPGLSQGQFASILAHEYGHFYNRDTAGGDLSYQVYETLNQMAIGLARGRARQAYNPVWWFVVTYHKIFLRVSQGASRLQEILADRFAAMAYGRTNFSEGLKNIIKQTIAFQLHANLEVSRSFELNQPISNIYTLPIQERLQGELEKRFDSAINQKTSPYDSHPSPMERIALIERMRIPYAIDQENTAPVLDLFPNVEALQSELTGQLIKNVRR